MRTPDSLPREARRDPHKSGDPTHFPSRIQNSVILWTGFQSVRITDQSND
jgi:hypothetical protein